MGEKGEPALWAEFSPRQRAFLDSFARLGVVDHACKATQISVQTAYRWRKRVEGFAEAFTEARQIAAWKLEQVARERATRLKGPSDKLLMFLLQANDPETFNPRHRHEIEHSGRSPVRVVVHQEDEGPMGGGDEDAG